MTAATATLRPMQATQAWRRGAVAAALWALRGEFAIVGVFSMATNVLMLVPTLYMLQVFDRVLVSRSEWTLIALSALTLLLLAIVAVAEKSRASALVHAGARLDERLNGRVLAASFAASLNPANENPGRSMSDLTELRQFLTGIGVFAFFDAPWTPIYVAALFFLHPALGLLALAFTAVQALLAWLGHHRAVPLSKALARELAHDQAHLLNHFREAEVVDPMGMSGGLRARWQQRHQAYMARHAVAQGLAHRIGAWSKFARYSQQSLALGAGAWLAVDGAISPGAVIAANVLMARALAPIDMMVTSWRGWIGARDAFNRLEALLQAHGAPGGGAPSNAQPGHCGALALRNVVARAPGREAPILQGVNVTLEPGTVTVVVGPSGAGKSTLARAMLGVWPDLDGEVFLLGRAAADWDRAELGPKLGYLPQDVALLNGTVAENIARFAGLDSPKVIAAAQGAGVHDMILRLPRGYDTPIGDGGRLLSGGQVQRLGLARAIHGDPLLVVLDEPNANLDEAGELALIQAVRALKSQGAAVVMVTHRPGALALADQVLTLRDGQVWSTAGQRESGPSRQPAAPPKL
jgi:ATP-binding cassette, subfamily C, bacterial exporter for protease/lipase